MKNLLWNFKKVFFKDTDLLTAEKLNNTNISDKTLEIFRLRGSLKQINNIYYFWNYDRDFKLLISKLKFRGQKNIAKDIAGLIESGVKFVLERENIDYIIKSAGISNEHDIIKQALKRNIIIISDLELFYLFFPFVC